MNRNTKYLLILFGTVFFAYFLYKTVSDNVISLPVYGDEDHKVEHFTMKDQMDETFRSEDYENKIWVVNSFFTSCPTICPQMMRNMQQVHNVIRGDDEILLVSFTVDPKRDTPERFSKYIERFNIDNDKWKLLTGDKKKLYTLIRNSFLISATDGIGDEMDFIHSENIVILDKNLKIRDFINGTAENADEKILTSITKLKKS